MQEYDKVIADYTEAIRIDPKNAGVYTTRGFAWALKQEYDKAIADFAEAIRIQPENHDAYIGRAFVATIRADARLGDGKKAVESATKACVLTKWNDANCLDALAAACAAVGDFESAVKWQTKANSLFTDERDKIRGESQLKLYQEMKALLRDLPGLNKPLLGSLRRPRILRAAVPSR